MKMKEFSITPLCGRKYGVSVVAYKINSTRKRCVGRWKNKVIRNRFEAEVPGGIKLEWKWGGFPHFTPAVAFGDCFFVKIQLKTILSYTTIPAKILPWTENTVIKITKQQVESQRLFMSSPESVARQSFSGKRQLRSGWNSVRKKVFAPKDRQS